MNALKKSTVIVELETRTVLVFSKLDKEEDFIRIKSVLMNHFAAVDLFVTEGPGLIVWEFFMDNVPLRLVNDDYGNWIFANTRDQIDVIQRIDREWHLYE